MAEPTATQRRDQGRLANSTIGTEYVLAGLAWAAGFRGDDLDTAVAVAMAESGGRANATNTNGNGTVDRGPWQINSVHKQFDANRLFDPIYNARAAYSLYKARGGFGDWVTYNTGAYKQYLPESKKAADLIKRSNGPNTIGGLDLPFDAHIPSVNLPKVPDPLESLRDFLNKLKVIFDGLFWLRVGKILLGIVGLIIAVQMIGKQYGLTLTPGAFGSWMTKGTFME